MQNKLGEENACRWVWVCVLKAFLDRSEKLVISVIKKTIKQYVL